jgi:hypothetical protein
MSPDSSPVPFSRLVAVADKLLEESDEDVERLAKKIGSLEPEVRSELLVSDLLNAWQVFYYWFRTVPDDLVRERMELEPASSLSRGLMIDEVEFLELFFVVKDDKPLIVISDGEKAVATFSGRTAYENGRTYLENPDYS